jgi:hypothetical protein
MNKKAMGDPRYALMLAVVNLTEQNHNEALKQVRIFEESLENNAYETLEEARKAIKGRLYCYAEQDCEGSHCCGDDEYEQVFTVGDKHYRATLTVSYNRHDKTYYYIDDTEFDVEEVPSA